MSFCGLEATLMAPSRASTLASSGGTASTTATCPAPEGGEARGGLGDHLKAKAPRLGLRSR